MTEQLVLTFPHPKPAHPEIHIATLQEPLLTSDPRIFCAAVDRNGYLGGHNKIYSQPQRLGDLTWNTAHSRNRRIFDDRAGLSAARSVRPYLIQNYPRDMGNGVTNLIREIDVPIQVFMQALGRFPNGVQKLCKKAKTAQSSHPKTSAPP